MRGKTRRHWRPGGVILSVDAVAGPFSPPGTTRRASAASTDGRTSSPWQQAMCTPRPTREGHTVGLRSDGTVLATGWNGDGHRDVTAWRDITAVAAGWRRTLGLLANGTVLAAGRRSEGQRDVQSWREMVALSCGDWHSVGVRADGTALAVGINRREQCAVEAWRDLSAVAAGYLHTVGLRNDGRVLATGDRTTGACEVDDWEDAVALAAGSYHTVGVTAFGDVLAVGDKPRAVRRPGLAQHRRSGGRFDPHPRSMRRRHGRQRGQQRRRSDRCRLLVGSSDCALRRACANARTAHAA